MDQTQLLTQVFWIKLSFDVTTFLGHKQFRRYVYIYLTIYVD